MKQIDLRLTETGWVANFVGNEEVRRSFGTTVIPTAFTAHADPQRVLQVIRTLNPGVEVRIANQI